MMAGIQGRCRGTKGLPPPTARRPGGLRVDHFGKAAPPAGGVGISLAGIDGAFGKPETVRHTH